MVMRAKIKVSARPKVADDTAVIPTYKEAGEIARLFAQGKYPFLIFGGPPGTSKSTHFRLALEREVGNRYCLIQANASARGAYVEAYKHIDQPILVDDAEPLFQQPEGLRFLKEIGSTEQWKLVTRDTKEFTKPSSKVPPRFMTSSPVCVITNEVDWKEGSVQLQAVFDRAIKYTFAPTALEIYHFVPEWFWDQEIFDFVARHYPYLAEPTCRLFYNTWVEKNAGRDWQKYVLGRVFGPDSLEARVAEVFAENPAADRQEMVRLLVAGGIGSRATCYRHYNALYDRWRLKELPALKVRGKPPGKRPRPEIPGQGQVEEEEEEGEGQE
jgi:hypothetical protein